MSLEFHFKNDLSILLCCFPPPSNILLLSCRYFLRRLVSCVCLLTRLMSALWHSFNCFECWYQMATGRDSRQIRGSQGKELPSRRSGTVQTSAREQERVFFSSFCFAHRQQTCLWRWNSIFIHSLSFFFFFTIHLCTKRAYCFFFPLTHTSLIPDIFHRFHSLPVTVESPIQKTPLHFVSFGHTHLS